MTADIGWDGALAAIQRATVAALNAQADTAQERTKRFVPKDTEGLEDSIDVKHATSADDVAQVYTDSEYAVYQHEALDLHHDDGQPKYMESAVVGGNSQAVLAKAATDAFQAAL